MWYSRIVANLGNIPDFIAHYENELEEAKRDIRMASQSQIEEVSLRIFENLLKKF